MSLTPETVTIQKESRTGDGVGGKVVTLSSIWTGLATRNLYNATSLWRIETVGSADGPGVVTQQKTMFKFDPPFPPDIGRDYRIIAADGTVFKVLFVRRYDFSLQVDAEVLQ